MNPELFTCEQTAVSLSDIDGEFASRCLLVRHEGDGMFDLVSGKGLLDGRAPAKNPRIECFALPLSGISSFPPAENF